MIDTILTSARSKMQKAFEVTQQDIGSVRTGRATPALVEHIAIEAYGGTQKLQLMEMATISAMDARTLLITPYDVSVIGEIVKGISEAKSGLNPVSEGDVIRITIPPLSEEQRAEYIKLANTKLEGGRIMIRQIRHEAMKDLNRELSEKLITEDQKKVGEKKVQELTDEFVRSIDDMGKKKEEELKQV